MAFLGLNFVLGQRLFFQKCAGTVDSFVLSKWYIEMTLFVFLLFPKAAKSVLTQCSRTLYSEKLLRITDYETQRMRVPSDQFNIKRLEFALNTNNTDAVIQNTKVWIHVMNKIHCQMALPLLQRCLRYIYKHQRDSDEAKDIFNFGPPVMRMMHFLNTPENALQVNCVTNWNFSFIFDISSANL